MKKIHKILIGMLGLVLFMSASSINYLGHDVMASAYNGSNVANLDDGKSIIGNGGNWDHNSNLLTKARKGYFYKSNFGFIHQDNDSRWRIVDQGYWDPDYGYSKFNANSISYSNFNNSKASDEDCIGINTSFNGDVVLFYAGDMGASYNFNNWRIYVNPHRTSYTIHFNRNGGTGGNDMANKTITISEYDYLVGMPDYIKGNQMGVGWKIHDSNTNVPINTYAADILKYADSNGDIYLDAQYDGTTPSGWYLRGKNLNDWGLDINDMIFLGNWDDALAKHVYLDSTVDTKTSDNGYKSLYIWPDSGDVAWRTYSAVHQQASLDGKVYGSFSTATSATNAFNNLIPSLSGYYTISATYNDNDTATFTFTFEKVRVDYHLQGHGSAISSAYTNYHSPITAPTAPVAAGYTFGGWYLDEECTNAWNFANDIVEDDLVFDLYAKWTVNTHTLTWNLVGGEATNEYTPSGDVNYGTTIVAPILTKVGYTFDGFDIDVPTTMPDHDVEITALYHQSSFYVHFETAGGSSITDQFIEAGSLVNKPDDPIKAGCTFLGWYKSDAYLEEWDFDNDVISSETTLYARYEDALETLRNLTISNINDIHDDFNNYLLEGVDITNASYTYQQAIDMVGGASTSEQLTKILDSYSKASAYIKARSSIFTFSLTWNLDGGVATNSYTSGQVNYGTPIVAPIVEKDGYQFVGWNESVPLTMPKNNLEFVAQYEALSYDITYKDQNNVPFSGPNITSLPSTHTYGSETPLINAVKEGYTFLGWYLDVECEQDPVTSLTATSYLDDVVLYAKWEVNSHTLSWNLDGGVATNSYTSGQVNYGTPIVAPIVEKDGYTFIGWDIEVPANMPDSNLVVTALYSRIVITSPTLNEELTATSGKVTVTWNDRLDNVDFYEIFIKESEEFDASGYLSLAGTSTYELSGLDVETTYYLKVVAHVDTTTYESNVIHFYIID